MVITIEDNVLKDIIDDVLGDTPRVEAECYAGAVEFVSARYSRIYGSMADAVEIHEFDKLSNRLMEAITKDLHGHD